MRHEKIVLVMLAYIIGFTTAYIGFGLTPEQSHKDHVVTTTSEKHNSTSTQQQHEKKGNVEVLFEEEGMFARVNGREVIVSGALRDGVSPGQGFHVAVPDYAVSPNEEFIYYCEQQTHDADTCHDYIYVIDEHLVRPLQFNGTHLTSSIIQSQFSWQDNGTAQYNGYRSLSPQRPWQLTQ